MRLAHAWLRAHLRQWTQLAAVVSETPTTNGGASGVGSRSLDALSPDEIDAVSRALAALVRASADAAVRVCRVPLAMPMAADTSTDALAADEVDVLADALRATAISDACAVRLHVHIGTHTHTH